MKTKNAIFCGALLALTAPYIFNILEHIRRSGGLLAESSIYSLNRHLYFAEFVRDGSLLFSGQHSIFLASYFVFYALWSSLTTIFSDTTSYFVLLIAFTALGLFYFVRLFLTIGEQPSDVTTRQWVVACALGVLYFSSLSIFNYLKSNAIFALPYLILPSLLYLSLTFIATSDKRRLIPLLLLSLVLTDLNLAHTVILVAFLNAFLFVAWQRDSLPARTFALRLALVNVVLAPAFCFLAVVTFEHALYSGSLSAFAANVVENMYSDNARYLNIFLQTTDWGLFGSWRGDLYYVFSPYYSRPPIKVFGLLPYLLLAFSAIVTNAGKAQRRLAASLLLIAVIIFQIMLGNNNLLYRLLYDHVSAFQVFRNITKLAPTLYFVVLLSLYILIRGRLNQRRYFLTIMAGIFAALVFNLPYWSYSGQLFADRTIGSIPAYWTDASTYLSRNAQPYSNILTLPAIYINDIYDWGGKTTWVQGSLLDIAAKNHSYRLSECCIGSPQFQHDARAVLEPSNRSVRGLDVNYSRLTGLVKKHHLDYVVVSADLRSEYQDLGDIYRWLKRTGYVARATFGPVSIYSNAANFTMPFAGGHLTFQEINPLRYRVYISQLRDTQKVTFSEPYNIGWAAFADANPSHAWCKPLPSILHDNSVIPCSAGTEKPWDEIVKIPRVSDLASVHRASASGGNEWVLNADSIKRMVPANAYRTNADGSIDIELELYFRPQGYFFLALFVLALAFLTMLGSLLCVSLRSERDGTLRAALIAMVVFVFTVAVVVKESSGPRAVRLESSGTGDAASGVTIEPASALTFYSPHQIADTLHFSLLRLRGPHGHATAHWNVTGCGNTARVSWSASSTAGEGLDARLSPMAIGNCLLQISAFTPDEGRATETIPITIMGPLSWSTKRYEPRIARVIPSNHTPSEVLTLSKVNDVRGVWPALADDGCGRIARVASDDGPPLRDGSDVSEATVRLQPIAPGVCTATLRDRYSPLQAKPVTLDVRVMGALSLAPDRERTTTVIRFKSVTSAKKTIVLYKGFDPEPIAPRFGTNGCVQVAGFYVENRTAPRKPVAQPATTAVTVAPARAGQCVSTFLDQYGANDTTLTIRVIVGR